MTRFLRSSAFILIFTAAACSGGDDGTSAGEGSTGSTSASSATTATTTTGAGSTTASTSAGTDSGTGTTDGTGSTSTTGPGTTGPGTTDPGTTGPGTTDPGTTAPGTTGTTDPGTTGTTGMGTTGMGTTGMGVDCSMLGPNQCKAEPMCLAIQGQKQNTQKMCLQKAMFFDCVPAMACGDAITVACDPMVMPPEPVQFNDTCIPDGWMPCDFPPLDKGC